MRFNLSKGQKITVKGQPFVVEEWKVGERLKTQCHSNNMAFFFSQKELIDFYLQGELEIHDNDWASKSSPGDLSQLPEHESKEAKRRYAYVIELEKFNMIKPKARTDLDKVIQTVANTLNDSKPPSGITLQRWRKDFVSSGSSILALAPKTSKKGNRVTRMAPTALAIIQKVIDEFYLTREQPTIQKSYMRICSLIEQENRFREKSDQIQIPSRSNIFRYFSKIDSYTLTEKRLGKRAADRMHKAYSKGKKTRRILERVEIDHTPVDLFVVDENTRLPLGRPYITVALDILSRSVAGFFVTFSPPSTLSVMECLRNAILPKGDISATYPSVKNTWEMYGVPEILVVDNGPEFKSSHLEDACLQMNINIQFCPPYVPWFKGAIERYFGSLNSSLIHEQKGTTFGKIYAKNEYDPLKNAVISFKAFLEALHVWVIDIYQMSFHKGISDTPNAVWNKNAADFPPVLPASRNFLNVILGHTIERTIGRQGIELKGLFYNSDELSAIRFRLTKGAKVIAKYNANDISHINIYDAFNKKYVAVPAIDMQYAARKTMWQHDVIRRYAREIARTNNITMADLYAAEERIRSLIKEDIEKAAKLTPKKKIARFQNIQQPHTTAASEDLANQESNPALEKQDKEVNRLDLDEFYSDVKGWKADFSLERE